MFRPRMQRHQNTQQGSSRAFTPYNGQRSNNGNIQNESNLQQSPVGDDSRQRGGRPAARRGKSVVRGEGRVVGRGRAMSPDNKLEQGLNESLFGSQHVSPRHQAQGIFTRQQKYSSRIKPNQGSSQKDARPSFIEHSPSTLKPAQTSVLGDAQQQPQQQPGFGRTPFGLPKKDTRPSFNKQPFSMPQSSAFDFNCTPQKPGFGGAQQKQPVFDRPSFGGKVSHTSPAQPTFGGNVSQQQQQSVFDRLSFGGNTSPLLGTAQHQPPLGDNVRTVKQSIMNPEYATKRSFDEADAENIAPNDPRKKQYTGHQQQKKEAVFRKGTLSPQAAPFRPENAIGRQALNPQAVPFRPAKPTGEQRLNPQATPFKPSKQPSYDRSREIQKKRRPVASDFFDLDEDDESTPQPNQHVTNENSPEKPKALEAAADPIVEQQRMEALMKRTAEQKEEQSRLQRVLQEKLRLEEEQKTATRKEKEDQEKARRLEEEAWRRRQEEELRRKVIEQRRVETFIQRTAELAEYARQKALQDKEEQNRRQRALQEKLRLEEEQKIMARKEKEEQEKVRRLEAEALKRRQEEERKRKANENCIREIATIYNMKQNKMRKFIHEKSKPWLSRSRHNIERRHASISRRAEILRFSVKLHNNNPYSGFKIDNLYKRYKLRTPEIMEDRAKIALQSEEIAEEFNVYQDEDELMSYVWRNENFNGFAYREVAKKLYQPQIEGKHAWTHLISCDPTATHSMKWFSHKFGLDSEFRKNTTRYEEVDVTTKLVYSTEQLSPKLNNEVEAITFVLPEKRVENECHDNELWQYQRDRLAKLIEALSKDRPDFQCPLLITYYSDDISDVHDTLYNIPELLGFKDEKTIMDYHVLLMRKESITTRICDEMFWLFGASVTC